MKKWNETFQSWKLIELGYVLDITKLMLRNNKIEELGI
jgi:hypothetical protein